MVKYKCKLCGAIIEGKDMSVMEMHWHDELHSDEVGLIEYLGNYVEVIDE